MSDASDETRFCNMPASAGKAAALSSNIPAADDEEPHLSSSTPVASAGPTGDDDETLLSSPTSEAYSGPADGNEPRLSASTPVVSAGPTGDDDETLLSSSNTNRGTILDTGTPPQPAEGIHLPKGYKLNNYEIIDKLGQGGFGITYRAREVTLNRNVVIKENLPKQLAGRDEKTYQVIPRRADKQEEASLTYEKSLDHFLKEAQTLSKLDHKNIVKVNTAFRALGTAYYVMPYVSGTSLNDDSVPKPMPESEIRTLLMAMLNALEYLHSKNLLHRDIKPANILRSQDGTPILIDFGTARELTNSSQTSIFHSDGYTPIEQYQSDGKLLGPWTDLYSLGATVYYLITGTVPMKSTDRSGRLDPHTPLANRSALQQKYSQQLLNSVDKAMARWSEDRWQNAAEWRQALIYDAEAAQKLLDAAESGRAEVARQLLDTGADREAKKQSGETALMLAAANGHAKIVNLLLNRKADLEAKDEAGKTALMLAAEQNQVPVVKMLLDKGAYVEAETISGETALIQAVKKGFDRIVSLLLNKQATLYAKDPSGKTALILATETNQARIVKMLLDKGAFVDDETPSGKTALMLAAEHGFGKIVKLLLSKKAETETATGDGETALILAAKNGHAQVSELLLKKGANIEAETESGETALLSAAEAGHSDVVVLLLNHKADLKHKNSAQKTARELAKENNHEQIVELIIRREQKDAEPGRLQKVYIRAKGESATLLHKMGEMITAVTARIKPVVGRWWGHFAKLLSDEIAKMKKRLKTIKAPLQQEIDRRKKELAKLLHDTTQNEDRQSYPEPVSKTERYSNYLCVYMLYLFLALFIFGGEKALLLQVLPAVFCLVRQYDKILWNKFLKEECSDVISYLSALSLILIVVYGIILIFHAFGSMSHVDFTTEYVIWLSICITLSCRCWPAGNPGVLLSVFSGGLAGIGLIGLCFLSPFAALSENGSSAVFSLYTWLCIMNLVPYLWGMVVSSRHRCDTFLISAGILIAYFFSWLIFG